MKKNLTNPNIFNSFLLLLFLLCIRVIWWFIMFLHSAVVLSEPSLMTCQGKSEKRIDRHRKKMSGWSELEQNDCVIQSYIEITLRCVWFLSLCGSRPTVGGKYCLGERKRFRSCNIDVSLIPTHHLLTLFVCLSVFLYEVFLQILTNVHISRLELWFVCGWILF